MSSASDSRQRLSRRTVSLALAFGATTLGACASSNWLEEKKLARVAFPRSILPIMVFRSDTIRRIDREGATDAVASALASALGDYGIQSTIVELDGQPRSPRLELALWNIEAGAYGVTRSPTLTVDCAYVSRGEQIAFVGRLRQTMGDIDSTSSFERVALAIAEKLASLT